jgi:hypothetical protein
MAENSPTPPGLIAENIVEKNVNIFVSLNSGIKQIQFF